MKVHVFRQVCVHLFACTGVCMGSVHLHTGADVCICTGVLLQGCVCVCVCVHPCVHVEKVEGYTCVLFFFQCALRVGKVCFFFFIFIKIYSLYKCDSLCQFQIALHCTLVRLPPPMYLLCVYEW
jgi:hypothetical protein